MEYSQASFMYQSRQVVNYFAGAPVAFKTWCGNCVTDFIIDSTVPIDAIVRAYMIVEISLIISDYIEINFQLAFKTWCEHQNRVGINCPPG